jgi:hypothetical protein
MILEETCKWQRTKPLIWETGCNHHIGTPRSWEPVPGMACMCCKKPLEVVEEQDNEK